MTGIPVIRYSTNPGDYTLVDGIVVDEQRPPGGILGVPANKVCCVAQFERGPVNEVLSFGTTDQLIKTMGALGPDASGVFYEGGLSLRGKKWGRLYVLRVSNGTMATAIANLDDSGIINVTDVSANSLGNWGNSLTVSIEAATDGVAGHFNAVIKRSGVVVERHQNLDPTIVLDAANYPITSDYVVITRIEAGGDAGRPVNVADSTLATGSDGTFADADYVGVASPATGLQVLRGDAASDIRWVFCGEQTTSAINDELELLATLGSIKNVLMSGAVGNTAAQAITDVALYRSDRIGYCYPHVKIWVSEANNGTGGLVTVSPASFVANTMAAMAPGQNPAGPNGVPYLKGIRSLNNPNLTNAEYEDFRAQGIMAFQFTKESQEFEIRSGVNTSLDSALHNWARRNMADYIQVSGSSFLVTFRNDRINNDNKLQVKVAFEDFLDFQVATGLLPSDADLNDNRPDGTPKLLAYIVDIASGNSPESEAEGIFVLDVRVRIHATMDFIVFRAEIGERVEITTEGF